MLNFGGEGEESDGGRSHGGGGDHGVQAIVPKITKMSKESTLSDAIDHTKKLQKSKWVSEKGGEDREMGELLCICIRKFIVVMHLY